MTATGHAVIGVAIAATISNPILAIPIALASHIAADLFPHWDTGTNRKSKSLRRFWTDTIFDVLLAIGLTVFLVRFLFPQTSLIYAFIIVTAASFFDIVTGPYLFFNWNFPPFSWAYKFQKKFDSKLDKPWGIVGQVTVLAIIVVIAWKLY
ncbi:MAG: hypothetical protein AAB520_01555 [Patescibacteria group bacterium]